MPRATRAATSAATAAATSKSPKQTVGAKSKTKTTSTTVKQEEASPDKTMANIKKRRLPAASTSTSRSKRVKQEDDVDTLSALQSPPASLSPKKEEEDSDNDLKTPKTTPSKTKAASTPKVLQDKKLKTYTQYANKSPFPDFAHPTPEECKLAHRILASLHGARTRPTEVVAPSNRAGCGDSPSVLDALVRTILSQNTSDKNSTRAKLSMDKTYGGSDKWDAIVAGGKEKLQESIKSGGLSAVKSKVIISILNQVQEKYGVYSLDHMHEASNEEAMTELISFQGVGPKTASCVLLFCLRRESFAVDTHVHRITGLLGWRPKNASRDETHAHLDVRIPDEDKYGLHILLVSHGKKCAECKAGGKNSGKCELRKAFRKEKIKEEAEDDLKEEEVEDIKEEEEEHVDVNEEDVSKSKRKGRSRNVKVEA